MKKVIHLEICTKMAYCNSNINALVVANVLKLFIFKIKFLSNTYESLKSTSIEHTEQLFQITILSHFPIHYNCDPTPSTSPISGWEGGGIFFLQLKIQKWLFEL